MARFIPIDKMKQLREAAKNGDERARKILHAQLNGSDFSADLDSYFASKPEPKAEPVQVSTEQAAESGDKQLSGLEQFLADNEITKDSPEYDDFVKDYYYEHPDEQKQEEDLVSVPMSDSDVEEELDLTKDIAEELIKVISACDQTLVMILNNDDIEDTTKKGAMTTLQEIKNSVLDSFDKVKKVKKALCKKEEENYEGV